MLEEKIRKIWEIWTGKNKKNQNAGKSSMIGVLRGNITAIVGRPDINHNLNLLLIDKRG
jgi:hypothetical protein